MRIRPMTVDDVATCAAISDDAFHAVDLAAHSPGEPIPRRRTAEHTAQWTMRTSTTVRTDPGGCVVAEEDGRIVGFATGSRRGRVWCLATYAVRPGRQGGGIGSALLERALDHARPCPRWMVSALADPKACRRYEAAGFTMTPQSAFHGAIDRSSLPGVDGIRLGEARDHDWIDELDTELRGGSHAPDRAALAATGPLYVLADRSGYVYTNGSSVALLAARAVASAERLLVHALREAREGFTLHHVTVANQWARDVATYAGLVEAPRGFLGLRGMKPPTPYIHNGALL